MTTKAVRFEKEINGRGYRIEVSQVGAERWRAQIVTSWGGPTALMPFYGQTPEHAAAGLSAWITRAQQSQAGGSAS